MNFTKLKCGASFAFQFLMDILRRLDPKESPCIESLWKRIYTVCEGHMIWLRQVRRLKVPSQSSNQPLEEEQPDQTRIGPQEAAIRPSSDRIENLLPNGCFAANYWPTGDLMQLPHDSLSWIPRNSIRDTAFQLLKIADFTRFAEKEHNKTRQDLRLLLNDIRIPYLHELGERDPRDVYAWPHAQDGGISSFRLDDHYWIWRALDAVESLIIGHSGSQTPSETNQLLHDTERVKWLCLLEDIHNTDKYEDDIKAACDRFSAFCKHLRSSDVHKGILKRFTAENESSRKRMLAVTRSPSETRFFLHARDTALLYGHGRRFTSLNVVNKDLWMETLWSQAFHEENNDPFDATWENTLRYALSILVALNGATLDKTSPVELLRHSIAILFRLSGHSGFIQGEKDAGTHLPLLFTEEEDRDYYYHTSFEVPYILLLSARQIDETLRHTATDITSSPQGKGQLEQQTIQPDKHSPIEQRQQMDLQPASQQLIVDAPANATYTYSSSQALELEKSGAPVYGNQQSISIKKAMPYGSINDDKNIKNIPEEWLYSYPEFLLTRDKGLLGDAIKSVELPDGRSFHGDNAESVIARGWNNCRHLNDFTCNGVAFVANAPKQKCKSKREKRRQDDEATATERNNRQLWGILGKKRTADTAKKRFIWLPHPNAETAFLCWLASTESEKKMSLFFDRHSRYEQHFWDSTNQRLNVWQTELHLSFYTLVHQNTQWHDGIPDKVQIPLPSSSMALRRASMGFRFDGDLFDRYWTCHFIQFVPCLGKHQNDGQALVPLHSRIVSPSYAGCEWNFEFDEDALGRFKEKHWWQRKVLELYLLKRILTLVIDSSQKVLVEVRQHLGIKSHIATLTTLTGEAYSSSKDDWKKFERILDGIKEDLTSMVKVLEQWKTREKDREPDDPRWTRNDERKYRSHINNLRASTERKILQLGIDRDNVRKLRDDLDTSMDKIRTDLELKREENIRYFTYVTVIFLPLGFAASFYSMVCG